MSWRIFLTIGALNAGLIFLVAGLHYGYHHHEPADTSAISEPPAHFTPWPAAVKEQFIESCVTHAPGGREQCQCTYDVYERYASLEEYLGWASVVVSQLPPEAEAMFARAGFECAALEIITPTPTPE
ncbi:MAG: hypothetical protein OXH97_09375 [Chloroflexota bacterium]|nr:hypothetical protein [Chloroflexota bacterium]MYB76924.1 hypothetical protein [Chloroflexota bacterium]